MLFRMISLFENMVIISEAIDLQIHEEENKLKRMSYMRYVPFSNNFNIPNHGLGKKTCGRER